jgi:cation:H+ antiporter
MIYVELIAGLLLLAIGGELLVRGAVDSARYLKVSPLLIGLTLIGFGTSTPELVTSLEAALVDSPGISVGNVVGSNIANILLILGLAALFRPIPTPNGSFLRDGGVLVASAIACAVIVFAGEVSRLAGAGFLVLLAIYLIYCYRNEQVVATPRQPVKILLSPWLAGAFAIGGLVLLITGARVLVFSAIDLARHAGISEAIIGLTIVALGTSLPELVTSVIASLRKQSDVAIGNIIGSNIFNTLGILGVTAVVRPIAVPQEIARFDIWVMMAATVALVVFAVSNWRLSRIEGAVLLAAYIAYIGYLASIS